MSTRTFKQSNSIFKKNAAEQIVEGIIYKAGAIDTQGEYALAPDLERAVEYLANNPEWPKVVDTRHNQIVNGSTLIESYIARSDGPFYKVGDWLGKIRVADEVWPEVENGTLRAFSIFGRATQEKTTFKGRSAKRLVAIQTELVSLVESGANQAPYIAKTEEPRWARELGSRLEDLSQRVDKLHETKTAEIEKEKARARRIAEVARPKRKVGNKNDRASVKPKDKEQRRKEQLRRHRKYLSAIAAIKHDGFGNFTDAQRRARDSLVDTSGLSPDHVWRGLFRVKP